MKTVFVGLSGGVDSSVAAALLIEQGYKVVGVYMKNWSQDLPGFSCPWQEDYQDAKRVAVQLGIDFKLFDFEVEYKHKVVDYMLEQYRAGRTPNPDIMCNQEIKFKLFLDTSLEQGADMIATGHYANTMNGQLLMATDSNKDQTYFLYRTTDKALRKCIFPLGKLKKSEVRKIAKNKNLITAQKKESMGICFVGKVGIKDFLRNFQKTVPGNILDQNNKPVGQHDGAIFYTIGQRHGLNVGGGLPFYVTGKDMLKNEIRVTTNLQDEKLWSDNLQIVDAHFIDSSEADQIYQEINLAKKIKSNSLKIRTRHRAPLISISSVKKLKNGNIQIKLDQEIRALTPGQSAVIYENDLCLGGGIVV